MHRRSFLQWLAPLTLGLSACTELDSPSSLESLPLEAGGAGEEPLASTTTPQLAPLSADAAKSLAASNNALGFDLYRKLAATPGNLALSPASISFALTMTYGGAAEETAAEMKRTMHLTGSMDETFDHAAKLSSALQDPKNPGKLRIANRLFGEKDYSFRADFLERNRASFGAPLAPLSFKRDPDVSRQKINAWVEQQTEKIIQNLLPDGSISGDTRLVLVNAIYFLADWAMPFDEGQTRSANFAAPAGSRSVLTMNNELSAPYGEVDGNQILQLDYKGHQTAMTVVLPKSGTSLAQLEATLSQEQLQRWTSDLSLQRLHVALPKFKLSPEKPVSLSGPLAELGMASAFDPDKANFSGIGSAQSEALFIDDVVHKAMVAVDEKGTEAAAASAVIMTAECSAAEPDVQFIADRPFLFLIRDLRSGAVLFMGRVEDPTA
jgi:serpin B